MWVSSAPGYPTARRSTSVRRCSARPKNPGRGRFLTGPLNWLKGNEQRVPALQMNFDVIHMESASVLFEELESAVATRTPIVLFNWTPSYIEFIHDGSFVEFPSFEEECPIDPGWGDNPNLTHDCGNASDGYLKMAISQRLPERSSRPRPPLPGWWRILRSSPSGPASDVQPNSALASTRASNRYWPNERSQRIR